MTSADLIALASRALIQNYKQQPIVLGRGRGVEVWDLEDRRYLDMTAGIAVSALGHGHPALVAAITEQAQTLLHASNLYFLERQILAADAITRRCFADRVFFCNSGAEANEAALKLARRYQAVVAGAPQRTRIITTKKSFHGRSMATLSVTGQDIYRDGFGPLIEPVTEIDFGDLDAAERALGTRDACAFIVEPIQAEGGIIVPPAGYLAGLRDLCTRTGTLLIFDEVQTGIGRTGAWFAHQHEEVTPDVMTLAKALGGGVPIGAIAATDDAARGLARIEGKAVPHASTFGGNPLACAAAVAVIETIDNEALLENAKEAGRYLNRRLEELVAKHPAIAVATRGRGLLQGLVLSQPAAAVAGSCREHGLLVSVAGGVVIRFVPALTVKRAHIDEAITILDSVLAASS